jgi:protein ImuA
MQGPNRDIIAVLKEQIHSMNGFKSLYANYEGECPKPFPDSLLNRSFPLGVIHEFVCEDRESYAATTGFTAGILASLMHNGRYVAWISTNSHLYPPAFSAFGVPPERIIFIRLNRENDVLWAMEEALKCDGLAAVIADVKELSFTASRRLQLAVEDSKVTGFVIRRNIRNLNTTACVTRWRITHLSTVSEDGLPGIGFPYWSVQLLKIRNGKPHNWQLKFAHGGFVVVPLLSQNIPEVHRKTG